MGILNTFKKRNKSKKIIGRGGKRGKTSGRGHKGQKQHGDHGIRPVLRDIIKKIPKLRGHGINRSRTVNSSKKTAFPINLEKLNQFYSEGEIVNTETLLEKGVIRKVVARKHYIKILGDGDLNVKLKFDGNDLKFSKQAVEKIKASKSEIVHE